jgi:hypothetical protein
MFKSTARFPKTLGISLMAGIALVLLPGHQKQRMRFSRRPIL